MLTDVFPRGHRRYESLPVLGPYLDGFVAWLQRQEYHRLQIRLRLKGTKRLDARLSRDGVGPHDLFVAQFLAYAPGDARDDVSLAAAVRSLAHYFEEQGLLAPTPVTPTDTLVARYRAHLTRVRGLSVLTVEAHCRTVADFLAVRRHDWAPDQLRNLDSGDIERFLQIAGRRQGRATLQHTVAHLRSFLRFLSASSLAPPNLDGQIDTPRVYRDERLPHALPWETVRALLRAIDRSTPNGRRDYAMLLLIATYGLRSCEVVALTLEDVDWRASCLRVPRSKVGSPLLLPLTAEVGHALVDYLRCSRPPLPHRELFLRLRAPAGILKRTALSGIFQGWVQRSGLPIPFKGSHCLRHSLAVHLLREGTPLKAIGDLLGHRSPESTCVYLRLHVDDLREVALPLPTEARQEARP